MAMLERDIEFGEDISREIMNDESLKFRGIDDSDDPHIREVYREIKNFYKIPDKHESPTRRLR